MDRDGEIVTTRILPASEWHRLSETDLGRVCGAAPNPAAVTAIVVEDAGEILGCWALFYVPHVEGLWVAPTSRRRGVVFGHLRKAMRALTAERGISQVMTGAMSDEVRALLAKSGAVEIGSQFVLPTGV